MRRLAIALALAWARLAEANPTLVRDVRIFDGSRVTVGSVLFDEHRIVAVGAHVAAPKGCAVVEGRGRTLLPGLIDAHTHSLAPGSQERALLFGVTTEIDLFGDAKQPRDGGPAAADVRTAGILATAPGGHGTEYGIAIPTLTKPEEAAKFVDDRIAEGSDFLKIVHDDAGWFFPKRIPTLDGPTVRALVAAAHARGKITVVHIGTEDDAKTAIEAGGDGLAHLFLDRAPEPGFASLVAAHHAFVTPTLDVLQMMVEGGGAAQLAEDPRLAPFLDEAAVRSLRAGFPRRLPADRWANATATVRALRDAKVDLLAGTDCGNPGTTHGASIHRELELLVAAGLTPTEALATATRLPAARYRLADRGRIAPGLRADLVLVDGDPSADITATRAIVSIWKGGALFDRAPFRARVEEERARIARERAAAPPPGSDGGKVSSFDDVRPGGQPKAAFGAGWSASTDALRGGKSTATITVVAPGAHGSRGALAIRGTLDGGLPFAWAGALFSPGAAPMTAANLSSKTRLRFLARGDGKRYRVMLFATRLGFAPASRGFDAGPEWKEVELPLESFQGLDGRDLLGVLWSAGREPGRFDLQIDDVRFE